MEKANLKFSEPLSGEKAYRFFHDSQIGAFILGDGMKVCKAEGCNRKHYAKGYCQNHYKQMRKYGKILKRIRSDPNEIIIKGKTAEVVLYNKRCKEKARTIIDAKDVKLVKKYKWYLSTKGYVETHEKGKIVGIQHVIMGVAPNRQKPIDHRDRNPLINRRFNLRMCTHADNMRNGNDKKNSISGYKGVSASGKKWRAVIVVNKRHIHLGAFKNILNAARAYNAAALKYHGEFACLNET